MRGLRFAGGLAAAVLLGAAVQHGYAGPSERNGSGISWDSAPPSASTSTIAWEKSFAAAKKRAAHERKPILLLHLFGRLDEDLC